MSQSLAAIAAEVAVMTPTLLAATGHLRLPSWPRRHGRWTWRDDGPGGGGGEWPDPAPWPQDPGGEPIPREVSDLTADDLITQWATATAPTEETVR
jgi:hypothetical protein